MLKEINNYKEGVYKVSEYKTNYHQLSFVIKNYFANDGFSPNNESDSLVLTFSKKGHLACNVNPKLNKLNYSGGTRSKCVVTFYVSIEISINNDFNKINIVTQVKEYNEPFNKNVYQKNILGTYKFDKKSLYKHLYQQFISKEAIRLTKELQNKIIAYNEKQSKEEKKIIAGKDY